MTTDGLTFFFTIVLVPVAVYGLARLVFTAYFRAKAEFLRRFFNGTDQTEGQDRG